MITQTQTQTKTVLHVGCGMQRPGALHEVFSKGDWKEVRLDINPDVKPDIVASITDMSPVETESVDAVWSSHNLEHLFSHEVPVALREFYRVLKPGGFALVTMPNLQAVAKHVAQGNLEDTLFVSPAGPIAALDIIFGHRASVLSGNHFMAHKTGFTAHTLGQKFRDVGFIKVQVKEEGYNLWAVGHKAERK